MWQTSNKLSAAEVVESNVPSPWATLCDQFESWRFGGIFFGEKNHDPLGCLRKFSDPWLFRERGFSVIPLSERGIVISYIYRPQHKGGTRMS